LPAGSVHRISATNPLSFAPPDWFALLQCRAVIFVEMSGTEQTIYFSLAYFLKSPALGTRTVWRLRGYCILVRKTAERVRMKTVSTPTTYMTAEELQQKAAAKFEEAKLLPDGPLRQEVLKSACGLRNLAEIKGWLYSELQPSK
jgi:hypothetical protein